METKMEMERKTAGGRIHLAFRRITPVHPIPRKVATALQWCMTNGLGREGDTFRPLGL